MLVALLLPTIKPWFWIWAVSTCVPANEKPPGSDETTSNRESVKGQLWFGAHAIVPSTTPVAATGAFWAPFSVTVTDPVSA